MKIRSIILLGIVISLFVVVPTQVQASTINDEAIYGIPECPPSHIDDSGNLIWDTPDGKNPFPECNGPGYVDISTTTTAPAEIIDAATLDCPDPNGCLVDYTPALEVTYTPTFTG